ncbi:MAG: TRAP transporter small permease [Clostridiales bacterium]|nr:TRAP transporter small permease [Clostridiales bacterium]
MSFLKRTYKILTQVETWFVFLIFLSATVATVINVIMRKVFGTSFNWIDELSRFIMIITVCMGMSIAITGRSHPKMDAVQGLFKGNAKKIVLLIADVVLAAIMIYVSVIAIGQELKTIRTGAAISTLPLKLWMFWMFVPLGFTGGSIRALFVVAFDIMAFWNQDPRKLDAAPAAGEEVAVP